MATVLRVECAATGEGPYWGRDDDPIIDNCVNKRHPLHGGEWNSEYAYRYGFRDLPQFKRWFPSYDRALLDVAGFVLAEYDVPDHDVVPGNRQVIFYTEDAVRVRCSPLVDREPDDPWQDEGGEG